MLIYISELCIVFLIQISNFQILIAVFVTLHHPVSEEIYHSNLYMVYFICGSKVNLLQNPQNFTFWTCFAKCFLAILRPSNLWTQNISFGPLSTPFRNYQYCQCFIDFLLVTHDSTCLITSVTWWLMLFEYSSQLTIAYEHRHVQTKLVIRLLL